MKTKLAVLISGSYRNFDSTWKVNEPILNSLGVPYEVFLHTWTANPNPEYNILEAEFNNRFYISLFEKFYSSFENCITSVKLESKFNFRFIKVDELPEKFLAEEFNLGNRTLNQRYQNLLNSCAMYFGIDLCRKEMLKDNSFTHFLRIRPDFLLDSKRLRELFENDLVFFGQLLPTDEGPIGDQCYGGLVGSGGEALNLIETLHEITNSPQWNVTKQMVLAEDVIRRKIYPLRKVLKIAYFEGSGSILRPYLTGRKFSAMFLGKAISHNLNVLFSFKNRFRSRYTK